PAGRRARRDAALPHLGGDRRLAAREARRPGLGRDLPVRDHAARRGGLLRARLEAAAISFPRGGDREAVAGAAGRVGPSRAPRPRSAPARRSRFASERSGTMSTSTVAPTSPWRIAAMPPIRTKRTPAAARAERSRSGSKSPLAIRGPRNRRARAQYEARDS